MIDVRDNSYIPDICSGSHNPRSIPEKGRKREAGVFISAGSSLREGSFASVNFTLARLDPTKMNTPAAVGH
jgi:hypothetical protein